MHATRESITRGESIELVHRFSIRPGTKLDGFFCDICGQFFYEKGMSLKDYIYAGRSCLNWPSLARENKMHLS